MRRRSLFQKGFIILVNSSLVRVRVADVSRQQPGVAPRLGAPKTRLHVLHNQRHVQRPERPQTVLLHLLPVLGLERLVAQVVALQEADRGTGGGDHRHALDPLRGRHHQEHLVGARQVRGHRERDGGPCDVQQVHHRVVGQVPAEVLQEGALHHPEEADLRCPPRRRRLRGGLLLADEGRVGKVGGGAREGGGGPSVAIHAKAIHRGLAQRAPDALGALDAL
mmetsp:Transcript_39710/g.102843  ORF Transcript_39710/g.102843 Transcript_39710/m.102843 type:complete len:222 (+) Transcript_39710:147-812(+)